MTHSEILKRAKGHIENYGWLRGQYWLPHTVGEASPVCAVGALKVAQNSLQFRGVSGYSASALYSFLSQALPTSYRPSLITGIGRTDSIINYNDRVDGTKEDILQLFDRAIALAEEQESGEPIGQRDGSSEGMVCEEPGALVVA